MTDANADARMSQARQMNEEIQALARIDGGQTALDVYVIAGPLDLIDQMFDQAAPFQTTCDAPFPMIALGFPANDFEGMQAKKRAESTPGLTVYTFPCVYPNL